MHKLIIFNSRNINKLLKTNNLFLDSNLCIIGNKLDIRNFRKTLKINDGVFYDDLSKNIINTLIKNNKKIILAESCTGGLISNELSKINDASKVFLGAYISYTKDTKKIMLNVKDKDITKYTPYSKQIVKQMLNGAIKNTNADFALATSCIAGPNGAINNKPVGTTYIGIMHNDIIKIKKSFFFGNRIDIQYQAAMHSLELLLKLLIKI